jgi:hypothetical protein
MTAKNLPMACSNSITKTSTEEFVTVVNAAHAARRTSTHVSRFFKPSSTNFHPGLALIGFGRLPRACNGVQKAFDRSTSRAKVQLAEGFMDKSAIPRLVTGRCRQEC